jgi:hypothetical protein
MDNSINYDQYKSKDLLELAHKNRYMYDKIRHAKSDEIDGILETMNLSSLMREKTEKEYLDGKIDETVTYYSKKDNEKIEEMQKKILFDTDTIISVKGIDYIFDKTNGNLYSISKGQKNKYVGKLLDEFKIDSSMPETIEKDISLRIDPSILYDDKKKKKKKSNKKQITLLKLQLDTNNVYYEKGEKRIYLGGLSSDGNSLIDRPEKKIKFIDYDNETYVRNLIFLTKYEKKMLIYIIDYFFNYKYNGLRNIILNSIYDRRFTQKKKKENKNINYAISLDIEIDLCKLFITIHLLTKYKKLINVCETMLSNNLGAKQMTPEQYKLYLMFGQLFNLNKFTDNELINFSDLRKKPVEEIKPILYLEIKNLKKELCIKLAENRSDLKSSIKYIQRVILMLILKNNLVKNDDNKLLSQLFIENQTYIYNIFILQDISIIKDKLKDITENCNTQNAEYSFFNQFMKTYKDLENNKINDIITCNITKIKKQMVSNVCDDLEKRGIPKSNTTSIQPSSISIEQFIDDIIKLSTNVSNFAIDTIVNLLSQDEQKVEEIKRKCETELTEIQYTQDISENLTQIFDRNNISDNNKYEEYVDKYDTFLNSQNIIKKMKKKKNNVFNNNKPLTEVIGRYNQQDIDQFNKKFLFMQTVSMKDLNDSFEEFNMYTIIDFVNDLVKYSLIPTEINIDSIDNSINIDNSLCTITNTDPLKKITECDINKQLLGDSFISNGKYKQNTFKTFILFMHNKLNNSNYTKQDYKKILQNEYKNNICIESEDYISISEFYNVFKSLKENGKDIPNNKFISYLNFENTRLALSEKYDIANFNKEFIKELKSEFNITDNSLQRILPGKLPFNFNILMYYFYDQTKNEEYVKSTISFSIKTPGSQEELLQTLKKTIKYPIANIDQITNNEIIFYIELYDEEVYETIKNIKEEFDDVYILTKQNKNFILRLSDDEYQNKLSILKQKYNVSAVTPIESASITLLLNVTEQELYKISTNEITEKYLSSYFEKELKNKIPFIISLNDAEKLEFIHFFPTIPLNEYFKGKVSEFIIHLTNNELTEIQQIDSFKSLHPTKVYYASLLTDFNSALKIKNDPRYKDKVRIKFQANFIIETAKIDKLKKIKQKIPNFKELSKLSGGGHKPIHNQESIYILNTINKSNGDGILKKNTIKLKKLFTGLGFKVKYLDILMDKQKKLSIKSKKNSQTGGSSRKSKYLVTFDIDDMLLDTKEIWNTLTKPPNNGGLGIKKTQLKIVSPSSKFKTDFLAQYRSNIDIDNSAFASNNSTKKAQIEVAKREGQQLANTVIATAQAAASDQAPGATPAFFDALADGQGGGGSYNDASKATKFLKNMIIYSKNKFIEENQEYNKIYKNLDNVANRDVKTFLKNAAFNGNEPAPDPDKQYQFVAKTIKDLIDVNRKTLESTTSILKSSGDDSNNDNNNDSSSNASPPTSPPTSTSTGSTQSTLHPDPAATQPNTGAATQPNTGAASVSTQTNSTQPLPPDPPTNSTQQLPPDPPTNSGQPSSGSNGKKNYTIEQQMKDLSGNSINENVIENLIKTEHKDKTDEEIDAIKNENLKLCNDHIYFDDTEIKNFMTQKGIHSTVVDANISSITTFSVIKNDHDSKMQSLDPIFTKSQNENQERTTLLQGDANFEIFNQNNDFLEAIAENDYKDLSLGAYKNFIEMLPKIKQLNLSTDSYKKGHQRVKDTILFKNLRDISAVLKVTKGNIKTNLDPAFSGPLPNPLSEDQIKFIIKLDFLYSIFVPLMENFKQLSPEEQAMSSAQDFKTNLMGKFDIEAVNNLKSDFDAGNFGNAMIKLADFIKENPSYLSLEEGTVKNLARSFNEEVLGGCRVIIKYRDVFIKPPTEGKTPEYEREMENIKTKGDAVVSKVSSNPNYGEMVGNAGVVCSSINEREKQGYYGPFSAVYDETQNTSDIFKNSFINDGIIEDLTVNKKNVIMFGFGFSGSGKTYQLISSQNKKENGGPNLLACILNELKKNTSLKKITFNYKELYPYHNKSVKKPPKIDTPEFADDALETADLTESNKDSEITKFLETFDKKNEEISIERIIEYRISPTPNNTESSRSHIIYEFTITFNDGSSSKVIIVDMAGTENTIEIKKDFLGLTYGGVEYGDVDGKKIPIEEFREACMAHQGAGGSQVPIGKITKNSSDDGNIIKKLMGAGNSVGSDKLLISQSYDSFFRIYDEDPLTSSDRVLVPIKKLHNIFKPLSLLIFQLDEEETDTLSFTNPLLNYTLLTSNGPKKDHKWPTNNVKTILKKRLKHFYRKIQDTSIEFKSEDSTKASKSKPYFFNDETELTDDHLKKIIESAKKVIFDIHEGGINKEGRIININKEATILSNLHSKIDYGDNEFEDETHIGSENKLEWFNLENLRKIVNAGEYVVIDDFIIRQYYILSGDAEGEYKAKNIDVGDDQLPTGDYINDLFLNENKGIIRKKKPDEVVIYKNSLEIVLVAIFKYYALPRFKKLGNVKQGKDVWKRENFNNVGTSKRQGGTKTTWKICMNCITILIYAFMTRYMEIVVNQGKGIVATLEHLKFFFLSKSTENSDGIPKSLIKYDNKPNNDGRELGSNFPVDVDVTNKNWHYEHMDPNAGLKEIRQRGFMNQYKMIDLLNNLAGADSTFINGSLGAGKLPKLVKVEGSKYIMLACILRTKLLSIESSQAGDAGDTEAQKLCKATQDTLELAENLASEPDKYSDKNPDAKKCLINPEADTCTGPAGGGSLNIKNKQKRRKSKDTRKRRKYRFVLNSTKKRKPKKRRSKRK